MVLFVDFGYPNFVVILNDKPLPLTYNLTYFDYIRGLNEKIVKVKTLHLTCGGFII